jgi:EamA domain-containing membrane protein RarD
MHDKTEAAIAIVAALVVLFSAMWDPRVSAAVAIVLMLAFGIYKAISGQRRRQ